MAAKWFAIFLSVVCGLVTVAAQAADITVMPTQAVKAVYLELIPDFEQKTQQGLDRLAEFKRNRDGEVVDVLFPGSGKVGMEPSDSP